MTNTKGKMTEMLEAAAGKVQNLDDKEAVLNEASAEERAAREKAVREAEERGTPLTAAEVMALRKQEELARLKAAKAILKKKRER